MTLKRILLRAIMHDADPGRTDIVHEMPEFYALLRAGFVRFEA